VLRILQNKEKTSLTELLFTVLLGLEGKFSLQHQNLKFRAPVMVAMALIEQGM
jgi:hypothetical protein